MGKSDATRASFRGPRFILSPKHGRCDDLSSQASDTAIERVGNNAAAVGATVRADVGHFTQRNRRPSLSGGLTGGIRVVYSLLWRSRFSVDTRRGAFAAGAGGRSGFARPGRVCPASATARATRERSGRCTGGPFETAVLDAAPGGGLGEQRFVSDGAAGHAESRARRVNRRGAGRDATTIPVPAPRRASRRPFPSPAPGRVSGRSISPDSTLVDVTASDPHASAGHGREHRQANRLPRFLDRVRASDRSLSAKRYIVVGKGLLSAVSV